MLAGHRLAAARAHERSSSRCTLYAPRSQMPIRSRVRRMDSRRESAADRIG